MKAAFLLALALAGPAQALTSAEIDAAWNFDDPAASERRFRAERARWSDGSREALEIDTQVARTLGLQKRYDEASALLDAVARTLPNVSARVDVRCFLERGRVYNSSGAAAQALPYFTGAAERAAADREPDAAYYRIDALHMMGIAAPASARTSWNRQALAAVDAATEPRARGWRASILNNLGWSLLDDGDATAALDAWQRALVAREATGNVALTRIARWTVARGLRANGRLDEAERVQRELAAELAREGKTDPDVQEELAEIAKAKAAR